MRKVKIVIIFILLLSIVSFLLTYYLYTTRENEKHQRIEVEEENAVLLTKNESLSSQITTFQTKNDEMDRRLSALIKEKSGLDQKINVLESEKQTALRKITSLQDEINSANKEFSDYKLKTAEIVSDFKEQNDKLRKELEDVKSKINTVSQAPQDSFSAGSPGLQQAVSSGQSGQDQVQIPKVVVSPSAVKTGKVVVVNRKFNFFICNLGQQDAVAINDQVAVYRNNLMIATAVVEKVYDNLSANGILKVKKGFSIQEGDIVKVKGA
jgi:hypothetical protein